MVENIERRRHIRSDCAMPLSFSLSVVEFTSLKNVEADGYVVDRSETGLGFLTDFHLEPGHILRLRDEKDAFVATKVNWVDEIDGKYRAGVFLYK